MSTATEMSLDDDILREAQRRGAEGEGLRVAGLLNAGIGQSQEQVRRALDRLVKRGAIQVTNTAKGQRRWRVA